MSTPPLTKQEVDRVKDMAGDVRLIRENCRPGASRNQLRHMTTQLRAIAEGDFHTAWRLLKLAGSARIPSARLNEDISNETIAICGGALDKRDPSQPHRELISSAKIVGTTVDGRPMEIETQALSWTAVGPSFGANQNVTTPFYSFDFEFHDFWNSCAVFHRGLKITRSEIVHYIANVRGGTHQRSGKLRPKTKEKYDLLDALSQGHTMMSRDSMFYVHMSIAQDFSKAPDVDRFLTLSDAL